MNPILKFIIKIAITLVLIVIMIFAAGSWIYLPAGISIILTLIVLGVIIAVWIPKKKEDETINKNIEYESKYNDSLKEIEDIKNQIKETESEIDLVINTYNEKLITREKSIEILKALKTKLNNLNAEKIEKDYKRQEANILAIAKKNINEKIINLEQLKNKGFITDDDFRRKKEELINVETKRLRNSGNNFSNTINEQEELLEKESPNFKLFFLLYIIIIIIMIVSIFYWSFL
jgi:hypothetical protein